jgi:hypothetical protein
MRMSSNQIHLFLNRHYANLFVLSTKAQIEFNQEETSWQRH